MPYVLAAQIAPNRNEIFISKKHKKKKRKDGSNEDRPH